MTQYEAICRVMRMAETNYLNRKIFSWLRPWTWFSNLECIMLDIPLDYEDYKALCVISQLIEHSNKFEKDK